MALFSALLASLILIGGSSSAQGYSTSDDPAPSDPPITDPIRVNNDTDLLALGYAGSGTPSDPIIFKAPKDPIDAQGIPSWIFIGNTTLSFKIGGWTIFNCSAAAPGESIYASGAAIVLYNVTGPCWITECVLYECPLGAWVDTSSNVTLSKNSIQDVQLQGIRLHNGRFGHADNNTCSGGLSGILAMSSGNVTLADNNCSSSEVGIDASALINAIIRDNTLWNDSIGLRLEGSSATVLSGNEVSACGVGVSLGSSSGVDVLLNTIRGCSLAGMLSNSTASPHDISGNQFLGPTPLALRISNSTLASVRNNTFSEASVAISLTSCSSCLLRDNTVAATAVGIYVEGGSGHRLVSNGVTGCSRAGLELRGTASVLILNNTAIDCTTGIWLGAACLDADVLGNTVSGVGGQGILVAEGSNSALVQENVLSGQGVAGVRVSTSSGAVLSRNRAQGCGVGIILEGSSGAAVSNNTCTAGQRGIELNASASSTVSYNLLQGNAQAGLYLRSCSSIVVSRNNLSSGSGSGLVALLGTGGRVDNNSVYSNIATGIRASGESGLVVLSNRFGANGQSAIWLSSCASCTVRGNTFSYDNIGIRATGGTGLLVVQNQIRNSVLDGLLLEATDLTEAHDNLVQSCLGYAVSSTASTNSRFYLNLFLLNNGTSAAFDPGRRQARDDSASSAWSSLAGHGNFWSDWSAPDANRDGIVDAPYDIVGAASDPRPLSGPLGPATGATFALGKVYVHLRWSAPNYTAVSPLSSYLVERRNTTSLVQFSLLPGVTEYNDTSVSALSDYTYDILAVSAQGRSVSITLVVRTADTIPPSVTITAPSWGSSINATAPRASWSGSDQGTGIVIYEYRLDSGPWVSVGLSDSIPLPAMGQGWHDLAVRATDGQGNAGSNSTRFFMDLYAPSLQISTPTPGQVQNQTAVLVGWQASDNGTGLKGYQVRLDQGNWSALLASNQTTLTVAAGTHLISVRAWDNVDQIVSSSVSVTIDPYAPVVEITSPRSSVTGSTEALLAWRATENITSVVSYEARVDGGAWQAMGLNLSLPLTLAEGEHLLEVRAQDRAGNYGYANMTLVVDLTAPSLFIIHPLNGTYSRQREVLVEWNVTASGSAISRFEVMVDGSLPWINVSTSTSYKTPPLAEGPHVIMVRAWDLAGNSALNSTSFVVDSVAPAVTWLGPSYGVFVNVTTLQLRWNASDDGSGLNTTYLLLDDQNPLDIGPVLNYTLTGLSEGAHRIYVRVFDRAGNSGTGGVLVPVDLTPPALTILYPLEGEIIQARDIKVDWTGSDSASGLSRYYIGVNSKGWVDVGMSTSNIFRGLSDGRHYVRVMAFDNAGNTIIRMINFTVDISMPVVEILLPSNGWTNSTSVMVVWQGSDTPLGMAYYHVRLDGGEWHNTSLGTSYLFEGLNLSAHLVEVRGVSNSSQETVAIMTFRIDLVAPSAPTVVQPSRYVSTGRISLTWGPASDNESGVSGYQVRVNRTYFNGTGYVTAVGPWTDVGLSLSYVSTGNEDGWYNVSVRARDRSGNLGPWDVAQLVLDTEPPRAVGYQPLGQSVGTSPVVVIHFSEPMARSSVSLEMGVGGSVAWEGDAVMRFTPGITLNYNRTYTVAVNGRDLAGNSMTSLLWQFTTIPNLGEVRGKVVDERGAPIQGALVSLESGQTEATDQFGEFSIDAPSGVHTLTIRYDGYNEIRLNVTLVAGASLDLGQTALSKSTTDFSWVIILTFVLLVAVAIELVYLRKKRKG